jgi:PAS domain S-box-containing protein
VALGLLMVAALAGNMMPLPLFFGVDFLFGSIAVLLVVSIFGTVPGVVVALVASSYTYLLWGHPWAAVIFTLEALVIGILLHRAKIHLIVSSALFWGLAGLPLAWVLYGGVMGLGTESTNLIFLKQSMNGIFNALLASIALLILGRVRPGAFGGSSSIPLYEALFIMATALIFLPSLAFTIAGSREVIQRIEEDVEDRLERNIANLRNQVRVWHGEHIDAVQHLARAAETEPTEVVAGGAAVLQMLLPEFQQILLLPAQGQFPDEAVEGFHRELEEIWRAEEREGPFTAFLSSRPGFQVIGAPFTDSTGRAGAAIGLLDLGRLNAVLQEGTFARSLFAIVMSEDDPLIVTSADDAHIHEILSRPREDPVSRHARSSFLFTPASRTLPEMIRWNRSYYAQETTLDIGNDWRLLVLIPVAPYQQMLHQRYAFNLALGLLLIYVTLFLVSFVSRFLSRPIVELAAVTSTLPDDLRGTSSFVWPRSNLREIDALIGNFDSMTLALQRNFADLERQRSELEHEMTERERVTAALRQREAELYSVLENAPDIIARFDREHRHIFINSGITRYTSLHPSQFLGKTSREVGMPGVLCDLWEQKLSRAWERKQQTDLEFSLPTAEGLASFQSRLVPEVNAAGDVISVLAITRDISELKDAQTLVTRQNQVLELLATGNSLQAVLETIIRVFEERNPRARCAVLLVNEESNHLQWIAAPSLPPAFTAAMGEIPVSPDAGSCGAAAFSGEEVITQDIQEDPRWAGSRQIAAQHGLRSCRSVPIRSANGQLLGTFCAYLPEPANSEMVSRRWMRGAARLAGIATDHARAEEALHRAEEDLRHYAEALEQRVEDRTAKLQESYQSLEGFCYTIAHDLRAPLRAIQGFSAALLEDDYQNKLGDEGQQFLRRIEKASLRMDLLIKDLLAYGRISHVDLPTETISLRRALSEVEHQLSSDLNQAGAHLEIVPGLASVTANSTILEQILLNLISNALKYVAPGITPSIRVWSEASGDRVRLFVRDNGIGIDLKHHERIFQVFERLETSSEYAGTGIGLAIARKGAERMAGRVGVDSEPGAGSTFWVDLPAGKDNGKRPTIPPPARLPETV